MNRIHIARNRQSLGQFSPEEVAEGLASGELLVTDLAWREPMDEWKPLSEFTDLPQAVASLTPPALPEASLEPDLQLEPAWERRAQLGTLSALVQTVRQVLSVPVATFKAMKREGGIATPLFFYLIVTTLTTWVAMGYQLIVVLMNPEAMLGPLAKNFHHCLFDWNSDPLDGSCADFHGCGGILRRRDFSFGVPASWKQRPTLRSDVSGLLLRGGAGLDFQARSDLRGHFVLCCGPWCC